MRIGVDFGGTKIEAAAIGAGGHFRTRLRTPTPSSYADAVEAVRQLVGQVEAEAGPVDRIGIGIPGSVSPTSGLIRNANTVYLNGRPFVTDLSQALDKQVRLSNDANCFAVSEAVDGAAAGGAVVFGAILGTGCGGGIAIAGEVHAGACGIAGEWGHNPLPWPDAEEVAAPACWCGRSGCLENWISGSGLSRDFEMRARRRLSAQEIVAAAQCGEPIARAALDRYVDRLARALATVVNLIDPDVIVLGGGMSNLPELYDRVPMAMRPYIFADRWDAPVRAAKWGDSSGVRGAARLWP